MLSPRIVTSPQQSQTASLSLQRAVRLLHMSSLEFLQNISAASQQNPFLDDECERPGEALPAALQAITADTAVTACASTQAPGDPAEAALDDGATEAPAGSDGQSTEFDTDAGPDGDSDSDGPAGDSWDSTGRVAAQPDGDFDRRAAGATLAQHLHAQLRLLRLSPRDLALACAVVEMLDDDGYLRCDPAAALAEIDAKAAAELAAWPEELQIAVRRVQSLEPAGVGARSVQECLHLQAADVACPRQRELIRKIVEQCLTQVAGHEHAAIAAKLRQPLADVEQACARIRHFDPRPGWRCGDTAAPYVTPDVIVQRRGKRWVALLNPAAVPRLRMNRQVLDLFERCRQDGNRSLTTQLQEARWTLRNIEQRFCTIVQVAQAIVDRQQRYFDYGEMGMKPLGLREVAQAVGIHESTVSRVVCGKYMATASGVVELRHFFSRTMVMPSGTVCSATAIRSLLRDMISQESPSAPLTDVDLAERLRVQGFPLARRTVTKYRLALHIDAASTRHAVRA